MKKNHAAQRGPAQDFLRFPLKHPTLRQFEFCMLAVQGWRKFARDRHNRQTRQYLLRPGVPDQLQHLCGPRNPKHRHSNKKIMQPMWPGQVDSVRSLLKHAVAPISEFLYAGVASEAAQFL
jgi:hypothetical protein